MPPISLYPYHFLNLRFSHNVLRLFLFLFLLVAIFLLFLYTASSLHYMFQASCSFSTFIFSRIYCCKHIRAKRHLFGWIPFAFTYFSSPRRAATDTVQLCLQLFLSLFNISLFFSEINSCHAYLQPITKQQNDYFFVTCYLILERTPKTLILILSYFLFYSIYSLLFRYFSTFPITIFKIHSSFILCFSM